MAAASPPQSAAVFPLVRSRARSRCSSRSSSAIYGVRLADSADRRRRKPLGDRGSRNARHRRLDRAAATGPRVSRAAADDDVGDGRRRLAPRRRRPDRDPPAERRGRRAHVAIDLRLHPRVRLRFAAFVAALAYASMGQVLQIGRMGESEALFTLLVSASLLLWHLGYMRGWPPLATWSIGFALRRAWPHS